MAMKQAPNIGKSIVTFAVISTTRTMPTSGAPHIPGAVNWSYDRALDMRTQTLKDADDLKRQLASVGVTPDKQVVVYCQSGARSSHSYLVVKSLGFPRVRNYKGSMIDWYQLRGLPLE